LQRATILSIVFSVFFMVRFLLYEVFWQQKTP